MSSTKQQFGRKHLQYLVTLFSVYVLSLGSSVVLADGGVVTTPPPTTGAVSATFVEDRDHVSIINFAGDYNKNLSNGQLNTEARAAVSNAFYKDHPDNYDFLVIFSTFEFDTGDAIAFHIGLNNNIQGIGLPTFNYSSQFGSEGKLKGYIDMAAMSRYNLDPLHPRFEDVLGTLSHEVLHQWGSHVKFRNPDNSLNDALLGKDGAHWSYLLDSDASVEYGSKWRDNGDGSFTSIATRKFYSPLDLYLMGMYNKDEVPPFYIIENSSIDKTKLPEENVTITGTKRIVTIDDVISAEGARIPAAATAQKNYRLGFILLTGSGEQISDATVTKLNHARNAFITRFAILTGGRGIAQVYPEAIPTDVVAEPGTVSGGDLRLTASSIDDAVTWLRGQQDVAGYWNDKDTTRLRDTAVTLKTLLAVDQGFTGTFSAIDWLGQQESTNTDYISRQLILLGASATENIQALKTRLLDSQNSDGGWGLAKGFDSDALDTALAIQGLLQSGGAQAAVDKAIQYLLDNQNIDGGWSNAKDKPSRTSVTTTVLNILKLVNKYQGAENTAFAWLNTKQNIDGGFGDSPSTVYDTSNALSAYMQFDRLTDIQADSAAAFIVSQQTVEGSFNGSTYNTALAIQTLKRFNFPNWSVDQTITVHPAAPTDGTRVKLTITIKNDSNLFTPEGVLRIYDGDPSAGGIAIGTDIVIPPIGPNAAVTISPLWDSFDKPGDHTFYAVVDPDATQSEMSEKDNQATILVTVAPAPSGMELSVVETDLAALPANPNRLPTTMGISADVRNFGLTDAPNVRVVLWKGGVGSGTIVDEVTVNIPNRSSMVTNFTNVLDAPGTTVYSVEIDPDNAIDETRKDNNSADISVTTDPSVDFAIDVSDITTNINPAIFGDDLIFTVNLHNYGTQDTPDSQVVYVVTNGIDTRQLGINTIQLTAGANTEQTITWRVDLTGDLTFTTIIDSDNLVSEIDETNNQASFSLSSQTANGPNLLVSHKDLSFNPIPGNEGYPVDLSLIIRNNGNTAATNVEVAFYDGEPTLGGVLLGTQTIATLAADGSSTVTYNWSVIPTASDKLIYVVVDPNNTIAEFSDADNTAFEVLSVLTLPDFAISTSNISITPAFPVPNDDVQIKATIANLGQQSASNIIVRAYDGEPSSGGVLIGEQTIAQLVGSNATTLTFNHTLTGTASAHPIVIQIDPDNLILERIRDNNTATKELAVQDGDAYVSEKIISPNGDNVKDKTEFFFRTISATNVTVQIVNHNNKIIRTYRNSSLNNITQGSVVWDGLDDLGRVVEDADYTLQVLDIAGQILANVVVTSDTNRSSLLKAVGTKYELYTNMTCEIPAFGDFSIADNEQDVNFRIYDGLSPAAAYPKGIYKMNDKGADLGVVVPESWFNTIPSALQSLNLKLNEGRPRSLISSADGSIMVFERVDRNSSNRSVYNWFIVDKKGESIRLLPRGSYNYAVISPDAKYIYYPISDDFNRINTESLVVNGYDNSDHYDFVDRSLSLSPDGKFLTYRYEMYEDDDEATLLLNTETGEIKLISDSYSNNFYNNGDVLWAPDSNKFVEPHYSSGYNLRVYNKNGILTNTFPVSKEMSIEEWSDPSWNSAGTEFAIRISGYELFGDGVGAIDTSVNANGGIYVANLLENTLTKVADLEACDYCLSSESYHISTWDGSNWVERGELHYRRFLREKTLDLSKFLPDSDGEYKVRIRQVGKEAAHVESVSLLSGRNRIVPTKATKLNKSLLNRLISLVSDKPRGDDVLEKIRFPDNELLDLYEQEMEVQWDNVAKGQKILLALNAREEELSKLNTLPFSYPTKEGDSYRYKLSDAGGLNFDGKYQANDKLGKPLFKTFTRPDTGHPPGTVYGYAKSDKKYLYGALDFTVDNTMDDDLDWASMRIKTSDGWKEYKYNVKDSTYVKVMFGKTPTVAYTHKYYEFRIPLSEINAESGDAIELNFQAYGTAAIVVATTSDIELSRYGSVHWDPASQSLLYESSYQGNWAIFLDENNKIKPLFTDWPSDMNSVDFIPSGRKLLFTSRRDRNNQTSICYQKGWTDQFTFESLQNLVVDLRASRSDREGGILLRGTAADLHFERYQLDYANVNSANIWKPVAPSSSVETIDDRFTTWVPPEKGNYFVRLTAYDTAGNSKQAIKRVSWGNNTSISDLYRTPEFISPNGDNIQDSMALHYRVLEPVHLEFNIFNENDDLVRTMSRDHSLIGTEFDLIWDGRDNTGLFVPDGKYKITVQNYQFFVIVDNTAPQITLKLNSAHQITTGYTPEHVVAPSLDFVISEKYGYSLDVESGEGLNPVAWNYLKTLKNVEEDTIALTLDTFVNNRFRGIVTDQAGNNSIYTTAIGEEEVVFVGRVGAESPNKKGDFFFNFSNALRTTISQSILEYKKSNATTWQQLSVEKSFVNRTLDMVQFSLLGIENEEGVQYNVRLKVTDINGVTSYSNERLLITPISKVPFVHSYAINNSPPFEIIHKWEASKDFNGLDISVIFLHGKNAVIPPGHSYVVDSKLFLQSDDDPRFASKTLFDEVSDTFNFNTLIKLNAEPELIENLKGCTDYTFIRETHVKFVDSTDSGNIRVGEQTIIKTEDVKSPCIGVKPKVLYSKVASCGGSPDNSIVLNLEPYTENEFNLKLMTLSKVDETTGVEDIIYNINKPIANELYKYTIDTTNVSDGAYSYKVKLVNDANQEWVGDIGIIVDHSPLTAEVTYPTDGQQLCGIPSVNQNGDYENILPIEILAGDSPVDTDDVLSINNVKDYLESNLEIAVGNPLDGKLQYTNLRTEPKFEDVQSILPLLKPLRISDAELTQIPYEKRLNKKIIDTSKVQIGTRAYIGALRESTSELHDGTYAELVNYDGEFTIKFTASDISGFKQCAIKTFSVDGKLEATRPMIDVKLFSPNGDGNLDEVNINYSVQESVLVSAEVYPGIMNKYGRFIPATTPVRSLSNNQQLLVGDHQLTWDGRNNSGTVVSNGLYAVVIFYKDSCGNLAKYQTSTMTVDTVAPAISINSPTGVDSLSLVVEVLTSVDDLHLKNYIVSYGVGSAPEQWINLGGGTRPLVQELAASWNTIGLVGDYSLRLAANDHAGNMSEIILPLNIVARTDLLSYVEAVPRLFSPNKDDKRETSTVRIGLLTDVSLTTTVKDETGAIVRTLSLNQTVAEGASNFAWDGKSDGGIDLPDATYTVFVNAVSIANPAIIQEETVSIILDRTAPAITITRPESGFASGTGSVIGTIEDAHIISYALSITDTPAAPVWSEMGTGNTNQYDAVLGSLETLAEGEYALKVVATDEGEIVSEKVIPFEVDSTPPVVEIFSPENNDFIGLGKAPVNITAKVDDKNIQLYTLSIGEGDAPTTWAELTSGSANVLNAAITTLDVGSYADGLYTLRLTANDKANNSAETSIVVTIDNTLPIAIITVPIADSYIKGPAEINGSATDLNFVDYTLSIAPGNVETANQWSELSNTTTAVDAARLLDWQLLPADGLYTLRLLVKDKADNVSEVKVPVHVDQTPPVAPSGLALSIEDKVNVRLTWNANIEPDFAGYAVYRDGARITTTLLTTLEYLDANVDEGLHKYTVTAFDFAAWESEKSNLVEVTIDTTPPRTDLHSPSEGKIVSGLVDIRGTAHSVDDFKEYRVYIGLGEAPSTWQLLRQSPVPTLADTLSEWNTVILTEGAVYTLKLESEDLTGNIGTDQVTVTIDNLPPATPTGLVAVKNISDVNLTWNPNTEPDLLGYLVFRDERIANSTGVVVGDLKPYAVINSAYPDISLPDGPYIYTIVAIDQAGNTSDPSLPSEVLIDTRPPHAVIQTPDDGHLFEQPLYINAVSEDSDIAEVQFQYRAVGATDWINLDIADTTNPYEVMLDPIAFGISYGDYKLQAIATDLGAKVDPTPAPITVTYKDLTRPDMTLDLANLVNAGDVSLTWTANTDTDLAGYHLERAEGLEGQANFVRITTSLVTVTSYVDSTVADSSYRYRVIAVDTSDNEADPSAESAATVYTPTLVQPYTPVNGVGPITITGQGIGLATTGGTVTTTLNVTNLASISTDDLGNFTLTNLTLEEGDNIYTIQLTDILGNTSKSATVLVQSGTPPSQPTGLMAANVGFDVSLNWNANPEANIAGYRVFRNEVSLLPNQQIIGLTATSSVGNSNAQSTVNGTTGTSGPWWSLYTFYPQEVTNDWLEIALPKLSFISQARLYWYNSNYRATDFDLQINNRGVWETIAEIRDNPVSGNVTIIDLNTSVSTNKLRVVFVKGAYERSTYQRLILTEVLLFKEVLQVTPDFIETAPNGNHSYTVTAVNTVGFESIPSEPATLPVGDATAPDAVTLTVNAIASDANLSWTASAATDVAKYEIYRDGTLLATHTNLTNLAYVDAGLINGTYTYLIKVVDNVGNVSVPSNEVQAIINATAPIAPVSLTIVAPAEGETLDLAWQPASGSTPSGYNVLRSLVANGPYEVISTNASEITFHDSGLTNGTTYYYVVLALDALGNVSVNSNEASGIPLDTIAPDVSIFYPTIPGKIFTTSEPSTNLIGSTEPGANVSIYHDGNLLEDVSSTMSADISRYDMDRRYEHHWMSPDGKFAILYYLDEDSYIYEIQLVNLDTNVTKTIMTTIRGFDRHVNWLPDSSSFVYLWTDDTGTTPKIYNISTNEITKLGAGAYDNIERFLLSPDGKKLLAYGSYYDRGWDYGFWLVDIESKQWEKLNIPTGARNQTTWSWSQDSTRVAYISNNNLLQIIDTKSGGVTDTGESALSQYQTSWSPDGKSVAYVNNGIRLYDVTSGTSQAIASLSDGINPQWTLEINKLVYVSNYGIYKYDFTTQESKKLYSQVAGNSNYYDQHLQTTKTGVLGFTAYPEFLRIVPAGHFEVENVELNPGDNIFTATATDASDNTSTMSDAIVVNLNLGDRPDLVVDETSIKYLPSFPLENSQARISVTVRNDGLIAAPASSLTFIAIDAEGNNVTLLDGNNLASIQPGSSQTLSADWSVGLAGLHNLVAVVDSVNDIPEVSEANNFALKEVRVNASSLPELTITTDKTAYSTDENALIDIAVHNSGDSFNGRVDIEIEDVAGYRVASISTNNISALAYADVFSLSETWNTGSTYAGNYIAKAKLFDAKGLQITEASSTFSISVVAGLTSTVTTDSAKYSGNSNVKVTGSIDYASGNSIFSNGIATLRIVDSNANLMAEVTRQLGDMLPGNKVTLSLDWNTGISAIGDYFVTLDVVREQQIVTDSATQFIVESGAPDLAGVLSLSAQAPAAGDSQTVTYTITNNGNAALVQLPTRVIFVDPSLQSLINTYSTTHDFTIGGSATSNAVFATVGLLLKEYNVVLQVNMDETGTLPNWVTLQSATFPLLDRTPPLVEIQQPLANSFIRGDAKAVIYAVDALSTVKTVNVSIDNTAWTTALINDASKGLYASALQTLAEGPHTLKAQAFDTWNNVSTTPLINFTVDNTAPVITITGVANAANYNTAVTPVITVEELNLKETFITLNGLPYISGTELTTEGPYTLVVRAVDLAGNAAQTEMSFLLDTTPPEVIVTGVANDAFYNIEVIPVITISDTNLVSQDISLNGQVYISGTPVNLEDVYQLIATATDIAGNTTTVTVNFEIDITPPVIGVTGVINNTIYNIDVTPVITVTDANLNSQTTLLNTQAYVSGTVVMLEGNYQLLITADDKAGNTASLTVNFELDKTVPSIVVTGVEDGGLYNTEVTPVITVTDKNLKSQGVSLDGQPFVSGTSLITEGLHQLAIVAEDIPGNQSSLSLYFEIDTTAPVVTITTPLAGEKLSTTITDVIGNTEALSTVFITVGTYTSSTMADANGSFSFLQVPLVEGENTIAAYARDRANNTGPTETVTVTVVLDNGELYSDIHPASGVLVWAPVKDEDCSKDAHYGHEEHSDDHDDDKDDDRNDDKHNTSSSSKDRDEHSDDSKDDDHDKKSDDSKDDDDDHDRDDDHKADCHTHQSNDFAGHTSDRVIDYVGKTLDGSVNDYLLVHSEAQFITALRSQRYGTMLLLEMHKGRSCDSDDDDDHDDKKHDDDDKGHNNNTSHSDDHDSKCDDDDEHHESSQLKISEKARHEIRAMAASGTGFVWVKTHPDNNEHWQDILGAKHKGVIAKVAGIELTTSPASQEGNWASSGKAARVEVTTGTAIGKLQPSDKPAMVLNTYAQGAVLLINFDPSLITNVSAAQTILVDALNYAASTNTQLLPGGLTEINWLAKKVEKGTDVRFDERLAEGMVFVNALEGTILNTKIEASWLRTYNTDEEYFNALVQLPVVKGIYTINGKLFRMESSFAFELVDGELELKLSKDRTDYGLALIESLSNISVPRKDEEEIDEALEHVQKALSMSTATLKEIEESIYHLVEAEEELADVNSDVSQIEAQLGNLLRTYQILWVELKNAK